jgi:hypothetical protein
MNAVILEALADFSLDDYRPIFSRDADLGEPAAPRRGNLVTVVTGMRRCGKSYRLFQQMDDLHEQGVPWDRMLYFNFEDNRLMPVTPATGDEVLEAFYYLHPDAVGEGAYLFLDELQEMDDWGLWLRRVVDTRKVTVYATGSSSRMLSSDLVTQFRGRSWECELWPLSFAEYVRFHGIAEARPPAAYSTDDRLRLQAALGDYLVRGGFPAIQNESVQRAVMTLQGYAQRVVARDVVERHNMGNAAAVTAFVRKVLASHGRGLSIRKTENELRSQGFAVGRSSLGDVLGYLEDAFLVSRLYEFSRSAARNPLGATKLYVVDPGLACANAPASTCDEGQRLEGVVYGELRRRQPVVRDGGVSFMRTGAGHEVDFVVGDALFGQSEGFYQVTRSIDDPAVFERETRSLWEALEEYGAAQGTLIVQEGAPQVLERDGRSVQVVPAWQWLMGEGA